MMVQKYKLLGQRPASLATYYLESKPKARILYIQTHIGNNQTSTHTPYTTQLTRLSYLTRV